MKMKSTIFAAAAALSAVSSLQGTVLLNDTFTYADGNLVGQGGWAAHSGAGAKPIQVTSGEISLTQSAGSGEDVNKALSATIGAGETYYAAFDLVVTGGSTTVYFAHFKDAGTGFNARLFITAPVAGGDFTFGISDISSSADATFGTDFSFGVTYHVVSSYDYDTGLSNLWIDPVTEGSTKITSITADIAQPMSTYAFRQAGGNSTQVIDNLVVGTTFAEVVPEPAAALLGSLGLLGLLRRRRI